VDVHPIHVSIEFSVAIGQYVRLAAFVSFYFEFMGCCLCFYWSTVIRRRRLIGTSRILDFVFPHLMNLFSNLFILYQASWFGKRFGSHRWTQTRKSVEGTLFASIAVYICLVSILMASEATVTLSQHVLLLLVSHLIMLFEAFTLQIDNLALPPIAFVLCACLLPIKV
jgi:hypothetical protein